MSNGYSKTVVSLFAGAGGLDLGLTMAGHKVVWANDFDQDSCDTYANNVGPHILCCDITSVEERVVPDSDLVAGGFPCQGFSVANRFRSEGDKRNALYLEFLRILRAKQPKWFVAENVSGILSLGQGKVFEMILGDFKDAGYKVTYRLENMANFGVPQTRKRVLILGTRSDLPEEFLLTHPEPTHSKEGDLLREQWVTMGQALSILASSEVEGDLQSNYSLVHRDFVGHRPTYSHKPSPTILARGNGKGGVNATPHPTENRRLSVMESAVIQSFPPSFKFSGSMTSRYRQIGNAVPPLYGLRLGEQLFRISGVEN
jgi:DNA (cytosine-5)-methyltransferase 1